MSEKQRTALKALLNVMLEHDIKIELGFDSSEFRQDPIMIPYVKDTEFDGNGQVIDAEWIGLIMEQSTDEGVSDEHE